MEGCFGWKNVCTPQTGRSGELTSLHSPIAKGWGGGGEGVVSTKAFRNPQNVAPPLRSTEWVVVGGRGSTLGEAKPNGAQ